MATQIAKSELATELLDFPTVYNLWSAGDWLADSNLDISANSTDNEIDILAANLAETPDNGEVIDGLISIVPADSIVEYLEEKRSELRNQCEYSHNWR